MKIRSNKRRGMSGNLAAEIATGQYVPRARSIAQSIARKARAQAIRKRGHA